MLTIARFFSGLFSVISGILGFVRDNDLRRAGQTEQQNADMKVEAEDAKRKADVMAESRTVDDTKRRLDDGSF